MVFADFVAQRAHGGNVLVTVSNDSWFSHSRLPFQHMAISVLRAVENRLPLVHLINNGPSVVVSSDGVILLSSHAQQSAAYWIDVPISVAVEASFYQRFGQWLLPLLLILLLGFAGKALSNTFLKSKAATTY